MFSDSIAGVNGRANLVREGKNDDTHAQLHTRFGKDCFNGIGKACQTITPAMKISLSPRFRSSVRIDSQNLANSFWSSTYPTIPCCPQFTPNASQVNRFVDDCPHAGL